MLKSLLALFDKGENNKKKNKTDPPMINKAGNYRPSYLKNRWGNTPRGSGYRYSVTYAPTSTSTCRSCRQKIVKGTLRIGRASPNPFDAQGGASDYVQYVHATHAVPWFMRSKCSSRVPLTTDDLAGYDTLTSTDKRQIAKDISAFRKLWVSKCDKDRDSRKQT